MDAAAAAEQTAGVRHRAEQSRARRRRALPSCEHVTRPHAAAASSSKKEADDMRWTTTSAISDGRGGGGAEQDLPASVIAQEWNCAGGHAEREPLSKCRGELLHERRRRALRGQAEHVTLFVRHLKFQAQTSARLSYVVSSSAATSGAMCVVRRASLAGTCRQLCDIPRRVRRLHVAALRSARRTRFALGERSAALAQAEKRAYRSWIRRGPWSRALAEQETP